MVLYALRFKNLSHNGLIQRFLKGPMCDYGQTSVSGAKSKKNELLEPVLFPGYSVDD